MKEKIAVIGGGITGIFSTLYLAQSGFEVSLYEKKSIVSETSDNFHGMIHSGARYAVNDPISAKECIQENRELSKIADSFIEDTGGYFLGFTDYEMEFGDRLIEGCRSAGIPAKELDVSEVLQAEPHVSSDLKRAIHVPDKVVHAFEFAIAAAADAKLSGANFHFNSTVDSLVFDGGSLSGINVIKNGKRRREKFDLAVNATGPFSIPLMERSGIPVPRMMPSVGSMVVYSGRFTNSVLNRMRMPSDGDIVVPYGSSSVLGTIATVVEDAENFQIEDEDIDSMKEEGARMIPALSRTPVRRLYSSVRPLMADESHDARTASRSYDILDYGTEGYHGLVSITGGKYTTGRLIGEMVARKIGEIYGSRISLKPPDLDTAFERYYRSGMLKDQRSYEMAMTRQGTMDHDIIIPAIAVSVAASLE